MGEYRRQMVDGGAARYKQTDLMRLPPNLNGQQLAIHPSIVELAPSHREIVRLMS
jgi:hypothetical protein